VQAISRTHPLTGRVQYPLGDHPGRPVPAFLARLEHEHHISGEVGAVPGKDPGRADQHRGVQVMSAGVHRALDATRVLDAGQLADRQGVHVGSEQYRGAGTAAAQYRGHRAELSAQRDLQVQVAQGFQNLLLRTRQVESDLRMGMQVTPELDEV
jgi:hypothetical protein